MKSFEFRGMQPAHLPTLFLAAEKSNSLYQSHSFEKLPIYLFTNFASCCGCGRGQSALKTVEHLIYNLAVLTNYQPAHLPTMFLAAEKSKCLYQSHSFEGLPIYLFTNFASCCGCGRGHSHCGLKTVEHLIYNIAVLTNYQSAHLPTMFLVGEKSK